jgi:hypothetical protein
VAGWAAVWWSRLRWLSREVAQWAFLAALAGFGLYITSNFAEVSVVAPAAWGVAEARGLVLRTLGLPLEMVIFVALEGLIMLTLRRWCLRHCVTVH